MGIFSEIKNRIEQIFENENLFEMTNLRPDETNIPGLIIYASQRMASHDIRIKVTRSTKPSKSNLIPISIRPVVKYARRQDNGKLSLEELKQIKEWVRLNYDVLVDYWDGNIMYSSDFLKAIKPLPTIQNV